MRIALTFFFALFKSTSCWILLLFLSLSVYHFLEVVFHGTFINFNVREEKKKTQNCCGMLQFLLLFLPRIAPLPIPCLYGTMQ